MKKVMKGLAVLSMGLLIAGCSCNKKVEQPIEENHQTEKINYISIPETLYAQVVDTTVRVTGTATNGGTSVGSGVVYKEEGNYAYILTNAHVVTNTSNADYYNNLEITFANSIRVKGTNMGFDKNEDVAVIRIEKSDNYKVATLAANDSATAAPQAVMAIGQPNKQFFAPTIGEITSTRIKTSTSYISNSTSTLTYVFNSTATINTGNSGGPLFNAAGEVIAINTMIPAATNNGETKVNHNYSIPVNYFKKVAEFVVTHAQNESYVHANLSIVGKSIRDYSTSEISNLGLRIYKGVYVTSSSEDEISIQSVIRAVNGTPIESVEDYEFELLKYSVGETIGLTICSPNGSNERTVNIRLHS